MGRRTARGRCSLSFDAPDQGALDLEDILRRDPWKEAKHFDGTDAGHVQNVLNQFNDAISERKQQPRPKKDPKRRRARGDEKKMAPTVADAEKAGNGTKAEAATDQADKHVDQVSVRRRTVTRKAKPSQPSNNRAEDKKSTRKRATRAPRSPRNEVRTRTDVKEEPLDERDRSSGTEARPVQVKREPLAADLSNLEQKLGRSPRLQTSTPKRRPSNSGKGRVKKENVSPVRLEKVKHEVRSVLENKKPPAKEIQVKKERPDTNEDEHGGSKVKPEKKKEGRRKTVDQETRPTEREKSQAYRMIARHERKAARAMNKFSRHVMRIVAKMGYPTNNADDFGSTSESDDSSSGSEYSWTCSCSCSSYCSCSSCSPGRSGDEYSEYTLNCSNCGHSSPGTTE